MVDYSKIKVGDVVNSHCCDSCIRHHGIKPKRPADSGAASWLCACCGHHGIGSSAQMIVGNWLTLTPIGSKFLSASKP